MRLIKMILSETTEYGGEFIKQITEPLYIPRIGETVIVKHRHKTVYNVITNYVGDVVEVSVLVRDP